MRDDFLEPTKREIEKRAGVKCSAPHCRRPTVGPTTVDRGAVSIGVAAHICAASPGGARYDASMTEEQRSSADNGIWLCQNCAHRVDHDHITVDVLREWKRGAENLAAQERDHFYPAGVGKPLGRSTKVLLHPQDLQKYIWRENIEATRVRWTITSENIGTKPSKDFFMSAKVAQMPCAVGKIWLQRWYNNGWRADHIESDSSIKVSTEPGHSFDPGDCVRLMTIEIHVKPPFVRELRVVTRWGDGEGAAAPLEFVASPEVLAKFYADTQYGDSRPDPSVGFLQLFGSQLPQGEASIGPNWPDRV